MKEKLNRRDFFTASAAVAAGLGLGWSPPLARGGAAPPSFQTRLHKALIVDRPTEEELRKLKEAGFGGVEAGIVDPEQARKCRETADKLGLRIHAVLRGWAEFNSPDRAKADQSLATTEAALRAAQGYGADAVLLVPCRIGGMSLPRPWEFVLEYDEGTGHLSRVVYGDNTRYADYIKAHNHAIDTSREAVQRLIPLAEKTGVVIALENVWNNLWVKPAHFRQFVASFQSRWVRAYFDIGNHVKYARPEEWILALGDLLAKCHVKDFKLNPADPDGGGSFVNIRDGSVRWPVVRSALDQVGYQGWMTIEGGDLSLAEHSRRLDLILAGE
jgi:hexulose-6-phosphate isomerase